MQEDGFRILEEEFVEKSRSLGAEKATVEKWTVLLEYKAYFEIKMGCSLYDLLALSKEKEIRAS